MFSRIEINEEEKSFKVDGKEIGGAVRGFTIASQPNGPIVADIRLLVDSVSLGGAGAELCLDVTPVRALDQASMIRQKRAEEEKARAEAKRPKWFKR